MMKAPLIKVCGITEREILKYLIQEHVDLAGFIFHPLSPRYIEPEKVKSMLAAAGRKKIRTVGVFVNEDVKKIRKIACELELDFIQLHGDEDETSIRSLGDLNIIKALRVDEYFNENTLSRFEKLPVKYILLDSSLKGLYGGTGETFNWAQASFVRARPNIFISGGLNEDNILEALQYFQPSGVDINSSVEKRPGIKSRKKINRLLDKIRNGGLYD